MVCNFAARGGVREVARTAHTALKFEAASFLLCVSVPLAFRVKFFFSFLFPACQLAIHPRAYKYLP